MQQRGQPRGAEAIVASQILVGSLAVEHDPHAGLGGALKQASLGVDDGAAERLTLRGDERCQVGRPFLRRHADVVTGGARGGAAASIHCPSSVAPPSPR